MSFIRLILVMCKPALRPVVVMGSLATLSVFAIIGITLAFPEPVVRLAIDEEVLPRLHTTKPPQCSNGYVYELDADVKVTACKEYVDIRRWKNGPTRNATRYTKKQWYLFTNMISAIEYDMGIKRIDEKQGIFTKDLRSIKLCEMVNGIPNGLGITLTIEQWFQLVNLYHRINSIMGITSAFEP